MSSLDTYARVNTPLPSAPKEWQPTVESDGSRGVAKNILASINATDRELMELAGINPDENVITGNRKHRQWQQTPGEEWLHWWGFDFSPRTQETPEEHAQEVTDLHALFKKRPPKIEKHVSSGDAFVFVAADWQVGKSTEHTINFLRERIQAAKQRVKDLRRCGATMPTLVILTLGDLVEGCSEHYAQQTFTVDLDRRGQVKVARRLIREVIEELAPLFTKVIVSGVGGNHGENRREGKSHTSLADNDDVAVLEMLQEVLEDRDGYQHVEFFIPDDDLSVCIDIEGVNVGFTHGHLLTRGGTLPQAKALEWWKNQIVGMGAVQNAQVLVTGHYHHLTVSTHGPRTHIQAPACDGGSAWWANLTGANSPDGVLTFRVSKDEALGWTDLAVL